jgi:signal transduction histidine kinase
MPRRLSVRSWLPMVALATACLTSVAAAEAATDQVSVLILLPGQPGLPAASLIATGIRSSLISEWSFRVSIETEHVDIARFPSPEVEEQRLRTLYAAKYGGNRFDLIVTVGLSPLRFVLRARDALWPGTPVIACVVDERTARTLSIPSGVTVITMRHDIEGTVRAALALLPDTAHVALIGGAAPVERGIHDMARAAIRAVATDVEIIELTQLPIAELMTRVSTLPERTVALVTNYETDATGRRLYGLDIVEPLARATNRPLFNMFSHVLGRGIVGGSLTDFEALGREAGALGLQVLRGEALPAPPRPTTVAPVLRFDGRQLARWGLDERRLPRGSDVLYVEPTFWQRYRWYAAGAIALIGAQAGLIVSLLLQRRERREAQALLAERLRFEALVNDIGAALTIAPAARIDEEIRECLRRVVTFLGVDRGLLRQPRPNSTAFTATHAWVAAETTGPTADIDLGRFPYFRSRMEAADGMLSFGNLSELSPDAVPERAHWTAAGIRSLVAIPLHAEDRLLGYLAFASVREGRGWPTEVIQQLRLMAERFASALLRTQSAAAVESSTALTGAVLAVLPGETAIIDASGIIMQTNDAWACAARHLPVEAADALAVGASYLQACQRAIAIPPGAAKKVEAGIESVLRGEREEFSLEYPTSRKGQDRWFEVRVRHVAHLEGGAAVMHLDVTKRRQDEAAARRDLSEIAHLDRVAAMGQLASSIAHELNQPLAAILTNAQAANRLLAQRHPDIAELAACLADIISDDRRAAEVIRRMRQLLKKTDVSTLPLALNDLVANTIGLVANDALLHAVSIEFTPAPALPVVHGDFVQIQQVVLNLLTNAIAAAAAGPPPWKVRLWTATAAEPYIELGVHDSGVGIADDDFPRLFEPFFTTKDDGLGMGLAIAQKIVEAHDGRLHAENDPAGGATFRVLLRTTD